MIGLLRGRVAMATLGEVLLDVGGVGYEVRIAPGTPVAPVGAELTLHTHLAVREDALTLYGFPDPSARTLFTTLLSVTGVGPKVALAALGTLGVDGVRRAVLTEDVAALTVIPGVARKGAQRMVLELRERLGAIPDDSVPGFAGDTGARGEVAQALAGLGYSTAEITATLDRLNGAGAQRQPEELLRDALRTIGGG